MIVVIGALGLRGTVDEPAPDGLAPEIACAAAAAGARVELISKAGDDPEGDAVLLALARAGVGHVATLRDPARLTPVRPRPAEPTDPADPALDAGAAGVGHGTSDGDAHGDAGTGEEPGSAGDEGTGEEPGSAIDTGTVEEPGSASDTGTVEEPDPGAGARPTLDAADISLALRYLTDFEVLVAVHSSPELLAEAVSAAGWTGARLVVVLEPDGEVPTGVPADALVVAAASDDAEGVGERVGRYAAALSRGDDAAAAYRDLTAAPSTWT